MVHNMFVVITDKNKVVSETLSASRKFALNRYKTKWLLSFSDPSREWTKRRRSGFRVAQVALKEVA